MNNKKDSLGNRMKTVYEEAYKIKLTGRMPVIVRLDGKAFHTYTKGMQKPLDMNLLIAFQEVAKTLFNEVQNCKLIYGQSDELSLLLINYGDIKTSSWFDNELQKIVSVTAAIASAAFTRQFPKKPLALFDSRAFALPREEVTNYFVWRQQDAERNSLQGLAQCYYSHKELNGKKQANLHDMLWKKNENWNNRAIFQKRGWCLKNGQFDMEIPIFKEDRKYIDELVYPDLYK